MSGQRLQFHLLIGLVLAILAPACGGAPAPAVTTGDVADELQLLLAGDDLAVGRPRVPFVLYDGVDFASGIAQVGAELFDLSEGTPRRVWAGDVAAYTDYEVPYYVVYPEVPVAGNWGLGLTIVQEDGRRRQASAVLRVAESPLGPALGSRPPASDNRTLDDEPDITLLSSGQDPVPALYELTVAEALASGRPTVVTFTTPRFCTSSLCAPVLDSVEAVYQAEKASTNFIHVEIYKTFEPLEVADEVEEWGLPSEPWTFVLDADGVVAARLAGPVSPKELTTALATVTQ